LLPLPLAFASAPTPARASASLARAPGKPSRRLAGCARRCSAAAEGRAAASPCPATLGPGLGCPHELPSPLAPQKLGGSGADGLAPTRQMRPGDGDLANTGLRARAKLAPTSPSESLLAARESDDNARAEASGALDAAAGAAGCAAGADDRACCCSAALP
jgi:hypothetical protein